MDKEKDLKSDLKDDDVKTDQVKDEKSVTDTKVDTSDSQSDSFASLASSLKELRSVINTANEKAHSDGSKRSSDVEKMQTLANEITELRSIVDKQATARKGEFDLETLQHDKSLRETGRAAFKGLVASKVRGNDEIKEVHDYNDDAYIGMVALGLRSPSESPVLMTYLRDSYPRAYKAAGMSVGGTNVGADWIPTGFSSSLIESVRLELRVAALHDRFTMPTNPYTFPVEGADIVAYMVPENTDADADLTAGNRVTAAAPGTSNLTFTATKVGVRVVLSQDLQEDSIIEVLGHARSRIVLAMAEGQENTVINGDTRVNLSNLAGSTPAASSQILAYNGYRRVAQQVSSEVDMGGVTLAGSTGLANLRKLRTSMGKYGVSNSQLAFVCGVNGYNQFLQIPEVVTLDKFGSRATILNGQIGALDGIPIIASSFVREDLNATGITDTVTPGALTEIVLVRRDAFKFADHRQVTLRTRDVIETDQIVLVALQRLDFKSVYPLNASNPVCAVGFNLAAV